MITSPILFSVAKTSWYYKSATSFALGLVPLEQEHIFFLSLTQHWMSYLIMADDHFPPKRLLLSKVTCHRHLQTTPYSMYQVIIKSQIGFSAFSVSLILQSLWKIHGSRTLAVSLSSTPEPDMLWTKSSERCGKQTVAINNGLTVGIIYESYVLLSLPYHWLQSFL